MSQGISTQRIEYIDIAKGLLIMCMLYGHVRVYGPMDGVNDHFMDLMSYPSVFYSAFFMQSFFIITGFCTSFIIDFKTFLWKNVKTLLIPSILLFLVSEFFKLIVFDHAITLEPLHKLASWFTTGAPWFIMAMFLGRLIYWPISRLSMCSQAIVLSALYLVGLITNRYSSIPNILWFQHTLLLTPYLFVGHQLRNRHLLENEKLLKYFALFGFLSISCQFVLGHWGYVIPSQDHSVCISLTNFPVHFINSITGTAIVFWVSKKISHCRFLSVLGMGTLLIYLWNGIVYRSIIRLFLPFYHQDSIMKCGLFHLVTLTLCYVIFYYLVSLIYNQRALKWIVGKW